MLGDKLVVTSAVYSENDCHTKARIMLYHTGLVQ